MQASIYVSAHHWRSGLLKNSDFDVPRMISEPKVYLVRCDAVLINLKEKAVAFNYLGIKKPASFKLAGF